MSISIGGVDVDVDADIGVDVDINLARRQVSPSFSTPLLCSGRIVC